MIQDTEDLTVRVNCSREEEGDGKQLVCLLLDPIPLDPDPLDPIPLDPLPSDPIPNDSAKENRFVIPRRCRLLKSVGYLGLLRHISLLLNCIFPF